MTSKRMITGDADAAVVSTDLLPAPLVMFVSSIVGISATAVITATLAFRAAEFVLLVLLPTLGLGWGGALALGPRWACGALGLDCHPSLAWSAGASVEEHWAATSLAGAMIAVASAGALTVAHGRCATTKARFLPCLSVLAHAALKSSAVIGHGEAAAWLQRPLTAGPLVLASPRTLLVALPLVLAFVNSQGPAFKEYFERGQKAAVAEAKRVGVGK